MFLGALHAIVQVKNYNVGDRLFEIDCDILDRITFTLKYFSEIFTEAKQTKLRICITTHHRFQNYNDQIGSGQGPISPEFYHWVFCKMDIKCTKFRVILGKKNLIMFS